MGKVSATAIAQQLHISRSYLYYLKDIGVVRPERSANGQLLWEADLIPILRSYLNSKKTAVRPTPPPYKTLKISNRRYLGNKYKLLPFIEEIVSQECGAIHTVADIFSGTGAVASAFQSKKMITNDLLYSNYICNLAWFGAESFDCKKISAHIQRYNQLQTNEENYMTENFSDTFFSRQDCAKIGFIRQDIEDLYQAKEINQRERALLVTSLLYAMDKIANTCGHYDAYRQGAAFEKTLELRAPMPEPNNPNNICYQMDANQLVRQIEADLIYIDPPYNSRQYCDAYHLLENVACWQKPEVKGVARKMDRTALKSSYCTAGAAAAFEDLIQHCKAKYILFSYNNMAAKGDDRSNAKIADEDIFRILKAKGEVQVFSRNYKAFTTGKSNISGNAERLFLCKCFDAKKETIQSPLNYIGGKYKLLPQILPLFPKDISYFVDLFCGGCNVGLNVDCSKVLFNDANHSLVGLYKTFQTLEKARTFALIKDVINRYGLSRSAEHGYAYYSCNSAGGLARYNKEPFLRLRQDFNQHQQQDELYYIMLYVLIVYSFNNQIRFNQAREFNLPVGKRDFNAKMQQKLSKLIDRIKSSDYTFTCMDFKSFRLNTLDANSLLYIDPPYLITCATYNEQNGWSPQQERQLLAFLDKVHKKGLRFALSNVLRSKGKENTILLKWLKRNSAHYRAIPLDYHYANSNYQTKDRSANTEEVLIVNY